MKENEFLVYKSPWYRKSPFHEAARHSGAKRYYIYNHMYGPSNFDTEVNEYWHLVNHVTLWDVGVERQVEIRGPDAFRFTNLLTPRDLSKCAIGDCRYVVLATPEGGIVNDPVLLRLGENHFWLSVSDSDVLLWAKGAAIHSGLDVDVHEPDVSPLQVQGPKSKAVVKALFGPEISEMPYYHLAETKLDGIPVVVTRTGWTAEVGFEIYLRDGTRGEELWNRVLEAGKPFGIKAAGPSEIRRIEAGILNYGSDMTLENNPFEVGLGWLVDEGKEADFIGKQSLRRIKAEGVRQKLVGIEMDDTKPVRWLPEFWPVEVGDRPVGRVTALIHSPRLKKNIGYAMVPIEHARLGTKLTVATAHGDRPATVLKKPFIDPRKSTPKS